MSIALQFGRQPPAEALRAWGARAIYKYGGYGHADVDLLWDRQDFATLDGQEKDGPAKLRFTAWVDSETHDGGLAAWCESERLMPNEDRVIERSHGSYHLEACPNRSHGYLYIVAYELPPARTTGKPVAYEPTPTT